MYTGSGKTMLALAIAGELEVPMLKVSAPSLVAGMSGDSERSIRDLFAQVCVYVCMHVLTLSHRLLSTRGVMSEGASCSSTKST